MKNECLVFKIVPILFFFLALIAGRPFPEFLPGLTSSELGLVESYQAILLLGAFCVAGSIFVSRAWKLNLD